VAALAAAIAALAAAGPATAEVTFRFEGRGFGHGVGMSQYGARGAALAGLSAEKIIKHYYRGTVIGSESTTTLRVRIGATRASARVGGSDTPVYAIALGEKRQVKLSQNVGYRAIVRGGGVRVIGVTGKTRLAATGSVLILPVEPGGLVTINGRRYRGALYLAAIGDRRFDVVNIVDLEAYLAGVLPREVPAGWGDDTPAALDAQAIVARSYALASRRPQSHFDLYDDTRSQVYGGYEDEDPRTTAAVVRTRGKVVTYGGRVIQAFFFSTSGGRTENVENVFGGDPEPYLRSVKDPWDRTSPYHARWPDPPTVSAARLGRLLGFGRPVRSFAITRRGASPRVITARVVTADGVAHTVSGAAVRKALGLRDTWFRVVRAGGPDRRSSELAATVELSAGQLRINQRIAQAAVRRVNALEARLDGRASSRPARSAPGRVRLSAAQLRINQRISQAAVRRVNALEARLDGRAPRAPRAAEPAGTVRLSAGQLRINQRISQAAIRRVAALADRVGEASAGSAG
jgi:stage II sporulation protein D